MAQSAAWTTEYQVGKLLNSYQGADCGRFVHVQQQQPGNEPHTLHMTNLHNTRQMVQSTACTAATAQQ